MSEYEYEEENLDDFMIKASQILLSQNNNEEKEIIIESLKQHLSSIFNNETEIQNFYKTLNMVIFSENNNKIKNRQCFKIFPIVFAFNPNSCFYYIDFFLFAINQCIKEENRPDFAFLSEIFSEVITLLFSKETTNKYLLSKSYLLEENKKYKLFEKLFNFLKEKIKSKEKIAQSFGCLLLTELIEKCPIIKEQKYLEEIFKLLSKNLEDKKFECKLDILNCLISLIFITEQKFRLYANICLFRVLDYLTDDQWIMRKLSINIVYTLVFFCKEEIMPVKNNIIEFLNILKDDPVDEIKEVCLQTLKLLEDEVDNKNDLKINGNGFVDNPKINGEKIIENKEEKNNDEFSDNNNSNKNENINLINDNETNKEKKINKFINKDNHISKTDKRNKVKINKANNKKETNKNKSYKIITKNINKNQNPKINNINIKYQKNRTPNRNKINQESKEENMIKTQIVPDKSQNDKSKIINSLANANTQNNSNNKNKETSQKPENEIKIQNETILNDINHKKESEDKIIDKPIEPVMEKENNGNNNINEEKKPLEKEDEQFEKTLGDIMNQLGKIQEGQVQFLNMINDLQTKLNDNYENLNERISTLEKNFSNDNDNTIKSSYMNNHNMIKINNKRKGKSHNYNDLKNKFKLGKYNEALTEAIHNENNLFKLLPLIDKDVICKINNEVMDDVINILNKKLILINLENGRTTLSDILSFYLCIIKTKLPLKLISQLNIKDSLEMFKNKNNDRLLQIDINNIDAIVKSLKV